jgi:hypothetical protein
MESLKAHRMLVPALNTCRRRLVEPCVHLRATGPIIRLVLIDFLSPYVTTTSSPQCSALLLARLLSLAINPGDWSRTVDNVHNCDTYIFLSCLTVSS